MNDSNRIIWMQTNGGPLMVAPTSVIHLWCGSYGLDGVLDEEADEEETDYWRACQVPDPVGVIAVAGTPAIVLRGGNVPTAYLPDLRIFIHEDAYAECGETVARVTRLLPTFQWNSAGTFTASETLRMFDAVLPGSEAMVDNVDIELQIGTYAIEWVYHRAVSSADVSVTLVRLANH